MRGFDFFKLSCNTASLSPEWIFPKGKMIKVVFLESGMKGIQRRVVHIKNTESELFEEAYLILREKETNDPEPESLAAEASRFLEKNAGGEGLERGSKRRRIIYSAAILGLSVAVAVLAALLLTEILN